MKTAITILLIMAFGLTGFSQQLIKKVQCKGITKENVQCKNMIKDSKAYCYLHKDQYVAPISTPALVDVIMIGNQVWMAKNLNVGVQIALEQEQTNNNVIEKWCYNGLESNCETDGGLYSWGEAMQYVNSEGGQGLCPDGFHVPSEAEYNILAEYLGGLAIAGAAMRTGIFALKYAGYRYIRFGEYKYDSKNTAYLTTSTREQANDFVDYPVFKTNASWMTGLNRYYNWETTGISIRCIKN